MLVTPPLPSRPADRTHNSSQHSATIPESSSQEVSRPASRKRRRPERFTSWLAFRSSSGNVEAGKRVYGRSHNGYARLRARTGRVILQTKWSPLWTTNWTANWTAYPPNTTTTPMTKYDRVVFV